VASSVFAYIRPAGGAPCAATASTESNSQNVVSGSAPVGPYTFSATHTEQAPGDFLLCGYLGTFTTTAVATSKVITIRPNRATLTVAGPPTALPDQPFVLTFQGATEVARTLYGTIKPAGGTGCGSSSSTDVGSVATLSGALQGAYTIPKSQSLHAGNYLVCAWVQETFTDLTPDAATTTTISIHLPDADADGVPDATDKCPTRPAATVSGCPPRVRFAAFTAAVKPARDRRAPFKFAFSGRLTPPAALSGADVCTGNVQVRIRRGRTTVSLRRVKLRSNCTWSLTVGFSNRSRIGRGNLTATASFLSNNLIAPGSAKVVRLRT
jgi:hypothetical protein